MTPCSQCRPDPCRLEAVPGLLEQEDIDRARAEWDVLKPVLTSRAGSRRSSRQRRSSHPRRRTVVQRDPDADGVLWADFEDATLGPIEWDMAGFGPDLGKVLRRGRARARTPALDERVQQVMDTARALQIMVCTPLVPQLPHWLTASACSSVSGGACRSLVDWADAEQVTSTTGSCPVSSAA